MNEEVNSDFHVCGRLTKSKSPCQKQATFYTACRTHATEQDKAIYLWGNAQWSRGYKTGAEQGRKAVLAEIEMEKRKAIFIAEEKQNFKLRTTSGTQIVKCGEYSYIVPLNIKDLSIGDTVLLPPNWLFNKPTESQITDLGSSYTGDLFYILSVVKRNSP